MSLFTREWKPSKPPKGVFLLLHGMESHSGWFGEFAGMLSQNSYAAIAFDRSGCGRSPGIKGHLDSYRDFLDLVFTIAADAQKKYGAVHLAGMSWGGMAALYLGLRKPWLFSSITMLAPGIETKHDIGIGGKLRAATALFAKNPTAPVRIPFRPEDFTRSKKWQQYIADDPDKSATVSAGFCLETVKMRRFIKETAGKRALPPALCLLAETDAIVNNPATRDIADKAGATVKTIPGTAHTLIFDNPAATAEELIRHADAARQATPSGNVWILGAGAVGGALAATLSHGRRNAAVLVKPTYLDHYRANGITLRSGQAERAARDLVFAATPADLPPDPELVVVAVKSFDTPALLTAIKPHLPAHTVIASIQNGITNEDKLATAFPRNTVVAASICAGLEMTAPGDILWPDDRGGLAAALYRGDADLARAAWQGAMPHTGLESRWIAGGNASARLKWSKLMLNIGFNALNTATGLTSAQILAHPEYAPLALTALREGFTVMDKLHLQPVDLPGYPISALRRLLKLPLGAARAVMSWQADRGQEAAFSMRQDLLKKRGSTEMAELNGKIVEIGRGLGVNVWANAKLVFMVEIG